MPRQLVLPLDYGILIKETAPVRLLDAVLEELDYKSYSICILRRKKI